MKKQTPVNLYARIALAAASCAIVMSGATNATAQEMSVDEVRVDFTGANMMLRDGSNDFFNEVDSQGQGMYGVHLELHNFLSMGLEYVYNGAERDDVLGSVFTDYQNHAVRARVGYQYDLVPFFRPYASASVGPSFEHAQVSIGNADFSENQVGVGGDVVAGMMLRWELSRVTLGVQNDYGFAWHTNTGFHELESEQAGLGPEPLDIGTLERRGFQWRVGLFVSIPLIARNGVRAPNGAPMTPAGSFNENPTVNEEGF